jgi:ActR/RegA family two-component response regulator
MQAKRVLFVDDEAGIRLTFPEILRLRGFEVRTAATVSEALCEITTQNFDILISDLNIGEPGDGFTVVSAMRRTQPECINLIITGFPAFENALSAIQRQVDDYLVKPAKVEHIISMIEKKLASKHPQAQPRPPMRLSRLLRDNMSEICDKVLSKMKVDPSLASVPLSDKARGGHLPTLVLEIADQLASAEPDLPTDQAIVSSFIHGKQRVADGYSISMLVTDTSILDEVVYDLVRERLLMMDTSNLVIDLKRFNHAIQMHLKGSIHAFWGETGSGTTRLDRG